jgi:hypothetical protein
MLSPLVSELKTEYVERIDDESVLWENKASWATNSQNLSV